MRITTFLNQKGGTAKSTSSHTTAVGLWKRGYKTLLIDADPQCNITYSMGADSTKAGLYDLLRGKAEVVDVIQHTMQGDIIASNLDLAGADMEFTQTGREYLLREALEQLSDEYTHVIIDSPPALGIMSVNALTASDDVVIPACPDMYSLQAIKQLLNTVQRVHKYSNPRLQIAGVLITRKGQNAIAVRTMIEQIQLCAESIGLNVYNAQIREATAVREAQIMQTNLFDHAPTAKVTGDYNLFIDEYLEQEGV